MAFYGWCGTILKVDLTSGQHRLEAVDAALLRDFIGGRGLAGHFLKDRVTCSWDDPEMPLLLFTGPLVNTASPTSGRMCIMSRSPLTGTVGDSSVGGRLGTQLKKAGLDGIIITGRSRYWCGIEVTENKVSIEPAQQLLGATTKAAADELKDKGAHAVIGPAAESGVRFANVMVDRHFASGRNGLGLVFAAKRLKYVSVRGSGKTPVYDSDALKQSCADIRRLVDASPVLSGRFGFSRFGTAALYDLTSSRRLMPTHNFRQTEFQHAAQMNAPALHDVYQPQRTGCRGCHILCKKKLKNGRHMPEFETLSHFSALLGNTDPHIVLEANRLCNELGMDTISAAATLACHAEIRRQPLAATEILDLLEQTAARRGTGDGLALGAAGYAAAEGKPALAMTVKGQELPAYDPRGAYGMALAYATSTRGGCHLRAYPISHEILRKPVATDRLSFTGKARMIKIAEDINATIDSLTACKFIFFAATMEEYAGVYSAVTGLAASGQDLLSAGERVYYNERIMNAANGFGHVADDLPLRFFQPPPPSAEGTAPEPIDRSAFLEARRRYYKIRGLDAQGRPTRQKADSLGLTLPGG